MLNKLDTPIKRIGFIVLVIGLSITITGALIDSENHYRYKWYHFLESFDTSYKRYYDYLIIYGSLISVIGLFTSFLYDSTIKKILHWVING
jgi:hypothetical protein